MTERRRTGEGFDWQAEGLRDDHRIQLVLLESLNVIQQMGDELSRHGLGPDDEPLAEALYYKREALDFLLNLDPIDLGDLDERPLPGQGSLFDTSRRDGSGIDVPDGDSP